MRAVIRIVREKSIKNCLCLISRSIVFFNLANNIKNPIKVKAKREKREIKDVPREMILGGHQKEKKTSKENIKRKHHKT